MYIGLILENLGSRSLYEREYTFEKGTLFIARNGILYNEIKANYVKVLKELEEGVYEIKEGYLEFESSENKKFLEKQLNKPIAEKILDTGKQEQVLAKEKTLEKEKPEILKAKKGK